MNGIGVLDRWLKDKQSKAAYRSIVNGFRVFAGCDSFEEVLELEDPKRVVLAWRDSLDVVPGSVNSYVSRVKSFYRHFGVDVGYIPRMRNQVVYPHKALTREEVGLLIEHGDIRDKALWWLLYSTGARIDSVLGLNYGRIDFRADAPVRLHFYARETKFNVEYNTFICSEALLALKNYMRWRRRQGEKMDPKSPLFITKYRERLGYVSSNKAVKLATGKAGIQKEDHERLAHHSFRAAFHRNLQIAGVNQYIIEKLMGHATEYTVTGRYSIGLTEEDLREAYMKAQWSLEVDEAKVKELEDSLNETQRSFGAEMVKYASMEARIQKLTEMVEASNETIAQILEGKTEENARS